MTAGFIAALSQTEMGVLTAEISAVETILASRLRSEVGLVENAALHTLNAGGKRLRPALVVLSARATGRPFSVDRARLLAACVETIHMATLMHDDVIDGSPIRRGRPTASAEFGNTAAILSGDVLLAKAMAFLAEDGDLSIIRTVSQAVVELAEGEVAELETRGQIELSEVAHLEILRKKTASLVSCCCRVGAKVAGAPSEEEEALARYGNEMGLAFQIVDDLLDYRGISQATGKARGQDFFEGCPTYPLIDLYHHSSSEERDRLGEWFGCEGDAESLALTIEMMQKKGTFERIESMVQDRIRSAKGALDALPESESRALLASVADFVGSRDR